MTVFNTGYATIEEAWGDITKKKKKKPQQDPICDLYEMKGNSSAYSETDLVNYSYDKSKYQRTQKDQPVKKHVNVDLDQDNYESRQLPNSLFEKQFEVRHPQSFDMEDPKDYMVRACQAPVHKRDDKKDDIYDDEEVKKKKKHIPVQQEHYYDESDSEEVFQEYLRKPTPSSHKTKEYIYQEARKETYTDTEDEEEDQPRHNIRQERSTRQERQYHTDTEDESYYEVERPIRRKKKSQFVYFDILLYILSGIILIFLLEQFVRIGIHMQQI